MHAVGGRRAGSGRCHRRLGAAALFVPFLPAAALVQTLAEPIGGTAILALVSAVIGSAGSPRSLLACIRQARLAELVLLALLDRSRRAAVIAGAGGLSSPLALLALDAAGRMPVGAARPHRR